MNQRFWEDLWRVLWIQGEVGWEEGGIEGTESGALREQVAELLEVAEAIPVAICHWRAKCRVCVEGRLDPLVSKFLVQEYWPVQV